MIESVCIMTQPPNVLHWTQAAAIDDAYNVTAMLQAKKVLARIEAAYACIDCGDTSHAVKLTGICKLANQAGCK